MGLLSTAVTRGLSSGFPGCLFGKRLALGHWAADLKTLPPPVGSHAVGIQPRYFCPSAVLDVLCGAFFGLFWNLAVGSREVKHDTFRFECFLDLLDMVTTYLPVSDI